jgi:hypothetical protein
MVWVMANVIECVLEDHKMVSLPKFSDPSDEADRRADEFRRLSPDERLRELLDTIETGMVLIRESKDRQAIDKAHLEREQDWQEIQKELIRRYGR